MNTEEFTKWLQGFIEIAEPKSLNAKQLQIIKDKLDQVYFENKKITFYTDQSTKNYTNDLPIFPYKTIC
jgi:hypothetical protein